MTPMERAAEALRGAVYEDDRVSDQMHQEAAKAAVRAVLAAIREPSDAVRRAMRDTVPVDGHEWEHMEREELGNGLVLDPAADHWRGMIDALLKET